MDTVPITAATRLVGLLGDPVGHSVSPHIHNTLFARLNLGYAYVALNTPGSHVYTAIQALRAMDFAGANVTIPHKQAAMRCCDVLSDLSHTIGAVNTLYFQDGLLHGTTTDPQGFFRALESISCDPAGRDIVILGNGGTARTLGLALLLLGQPASLSFIGRNESRVTALVDEIARHGDTPVRAALFGSTGAARALEQCTLLVNCTSVGMHPRTDASPLPPEALHSRMTVFDAIYNPLQTRLLQHAKARGCPCSNGLSMLLYQGLASFEYWTGVQVPDGTISVEEVEGFLDSQLEKYTRDT